MSRGAKLLQRPGRHRGVGLVDRASGALARRVVHGLMSRFEHGRLTVIDDDGSRTFGADHEFEAVARVLDQRAYTAIATGGSAGLGRAYFEQWWDSPDPVAVLRVLIRNMAPWDRRRDRVRRVVAPVTDRLRRWVPAPNRDRNRLDISAHYDLGNDFFSLFLDETLTYSAAVFPDEDAELAAASRHKYDLLLGKLGVDATDHLVEIGTGWGGLAVHAATTIGCEVTTTTISAEQRSYALERVADAAVGDRVEVLDRDWRDLAGRYDHLVSIEMIEAVDWRDYGAFFATIDRLVAPGGRAALQAIVVPDERWERTKTTVDFIRRYVFPNGMLPSVHAIEQAVASTSFEVIDVEDFTEQYAVTLRRWRENFDTAHAEVRALGFDERFVRLWRFYLMYCEAGFVERHVELKQVVLARRDSIGNMSDHDASQPDDGTADHDDESVAEKLHEAIGGDNEPAQELLEEVVGDDDPAAIDDERADGES